MSPVLFSYRQFYSMRLPLDNAPRMDYPCIDMDKTTEPS